MSNNYPHGVLVGVDGSPESDAAVRWAAAEAKMVGAPLTLMHAVAPLVISSPMGTVPDVVVDAEGETAALVIEQSRDVAAAIDADVDIRTEVRFARAVPTLADASKDAVMAVVGTRGMGAIGRAVLGSVSSGLVHHGYGPVAVIHAEAGHLPAAGPVVVGIDGSPASEAATELAFVEAARRKADVVAVHAWSDVGVLPIFGMDWRDYEQRGEETLAERLAGWQELYPDVRIRRRLECDKPARWLLDEASDAQLLIVGSHGRGGFSGMLLGSVSSSIAQSSPVPVIVVRPR